ncbi:MAG: hypothetical protein AAFU65_04010 [Pseudomonadota bacterium]
MTDFIRCVRALAPAMLLAAAVGAHAQNVKLEYRLDLTDAPEAARASVTVIQSDGELRTLRFKPETGRFTDFAADTPLSDEDGRMTWTVPENGGTLSWRAPITNVRSNDALDARLGNRWALFRAEDAFPSMASRAAADTEVTATLNVDLPEEWSFLSALSQADEGWQVEDTPRRIDRPTGWMIAGAIGVRIDRIAGVRSVVAAPRGQKVRRQDILALLNWVMPDLVRVLPDYPMDLLIVSAEDPFWRGGLSGPASLYLHADRPLISENGTSTLVHELFHVGFRRPGGPKDDWIIEGLAEFYSVQLLRRSGSTTASRYDKTLRSLERWAKKAGPLRVSRSSGATTARAVGVFVALDEEIRRASRASLDDVVRVLAAGEGAVTLDELREAVTATMGARSAVLAAIDAPAEDD